MYLDEYKRWLAADLEDADLKPELAKIEGNDDEIKDRFAVALKFGTPVCAESSVTSFPAATPPDMP